MIVGRPLLHALVNPGVASGFGIEIDRIKCDKAAAFLKHSLTELGRRGGGAALALPRVQCSSIEKASPPFHRLEHLVDPYPLVAHLFIGLSTLWTLTPLWPTFSSA